MNKRIHKKHMKIVQNWLHPSSKIITGLDGHPYFDDVYHGSKYDCRIIDLYKFHQMERYIGRKGDFS